MRTEIGNIQDLFGMLQQLAELIQKSAVLF